MLKIKEKEEVKTQHNNIFMNEQNKENNSEKQDKSNKDREKSNDIFFNLTKKIAAKKI